jgi:hypothetical protein
MCRNENTASPNLGVAVGCSGFLIVRKRVGLCEMKGRFDNYKRAFENQKPETRNPNEAPNPKPEAGVDSSFGVSGFGH